MTTIKIITRSQWGAEKGSTLSTNISPQYGGVAIHYVGGSGSLVTMSHAKCAAVVRNIQHQHIHDNDWADIAYSYLACPHGFLFEGRGLNKRTAANGTTSANQNYYAICGLINNGEKPPQKMLDAISFGVAYLRQKGKAGKKVVGHRNLKSTDCPGPLYRYVQDGSFIPGDPQNNTYPGSPVKRGDSGPLVGKVQKRLNQLGADLAEDNDFGPKTENEVKDYQREHSLQVTGKVNEETWDSLF